MDKDCVPNVEEEVIRKRLNQIEVKALQLYRYGYSQGNFESGKKAEKAFADGYTAGQSDNSDNNSAYQCGYENGCNDVWDLFYRLYIEMDYKDILAAFDIQYFSEILENMSPAEVITKLKARDDKKAKEITESPILCGYKDLSVGEEVQDCSDCIGVITNIDTAIHVLYKNGKTHKWGKNTKFLKTGKHVANIWEWMG